MTDDNLPIEPPGKGGDQLPARQDPNLRRALAQTHGGGLRLAQFDDRADEDDEQIDLLKYWRVLVKHRWLVLGILVATAALSLASTLMTTPMYRATATMQIQAETTQVMQFQGQSFDMYAGNDFLQTQMELLRSRSLAERVAGKLNLNQAAIDRLEDPGLTTRLMSLLRARPATVGPAAGAGDPGQAANTRRAVAGMVQGGVGVSPVGESELVAISYESTSPDFSVLVANTVADEFIASYRDRRFGASSYAKDYLEDQLALTKARLEESERKLIEYARQHGLVIADEKGQTMAAQNLVALNAALMAAREQRIRAQARAASGVVPPEMLTASAVSTLQQQRATLMGQYQQKLAIFKPDYPEMKQLQQQIDEVNRQIGSEMGRVQSTVRAEYQAAAATENALNQQIAGLRTQAFDAEGSNVEYSILKRDVDTNRQLYDGLLQRFKEIGAASDQRSDSLSVVDRAEGAYRFKPNLYQNLQRGILLGLLLGVLAAFMLEYFDDTLKTPEDVEQKLRLAVLGVIPKLGPRQGFVEASKDSRSAFSEAYRSVRAALQFTTDHGVPKTLLVTSPGPGEAKSTTSLVLARNFAQLGRRVLLVEADLRNPSLARTLGLRDQPMGLSNLLAGACTLKEATAETDDPRLNVVLAGPLPPNPAELLSGSKLVSMLTIAVEQYDQIVIDGPPVLGLADAPILANVADGTLLMVDAGRTKISAAQASLKRLLSARARVVGALLSKYDAKASGYGYQYEGYYARDAKPRLGKG